MKKFEVELTQQIEQHATIEVEAESEEEAEAIAHEQTEDKDWIFSFHIDWKVDKVTEIE